QAAQDAWGLTVCEGACPDRAEADSDVCMLQSGGQSPASMCWHQIYVLHFRFLQSLQLKRPDVGSAVAGRIQGETRGQMRDTPTTRNPGWHGSSLPGFLLSLSRYLFHKLHSGVIRPLLNSRSAYGPHW